MIRERRLLQELRPGNLALARHQPIRPESLLVEEERLLETERVVELLVERGVEAIGVDADLREERSGVLREGRWAGVDLLGPSVSDEEPIAVPELVALGMTPEVVVVVEEENPRAGAHRFAELERRRQTAEPGANDHEVERLSGRDGAEGPTLLVAEPVRDLERPVVASAHAGESGRVVARVLLRERPAAEGLESRAQLGSEERARDSDGGAVEKVPPGDGVVHGRHAKRAYPRSQSSMPSSSIHLSRISSSARFVEAISFSTGSTSAKGWV
jgi:hypothetical protein